MDTTNKKIEFGTAAAQLGPTPLAIKMIYRILGALTALFTAFTLAFPNVISQHVQLVTLQSCAFGTTAIYILCQQFGWVSPAKIESNS